MGRIGRTRYLSCFYCGKQSRLKYDGTITNFLCLSCDATNYLDENGEITDPPVATEREAAPSQYAKQPSVAATTASEQDSVFCEKCRKNQRLFTASLAQYLPDDPSHPDYEELDRNYYRYRRNLEKRYPQVCDECEDKVQERIRQAGYTAKTDHLRRMMDKTRGRKATRRTSTLDVASRFGGWLWRGGLVAQLLWHLVCITQALEQSDNGMRDPDDTSILTTALELTKTGLGWLPNGDALIRISIATAILSSWWNPHFVQFTRGFTKHLLGFTRWYSFQGLIVFFRVLFRSVLGMEGGEARSQSAQLSIHMTTAAIMCFIYVMASKSIRVDTTPLFRPEDKPATPRRTMTPAKRKEEDSKTFSELFNEALDSTPQNGGLGSLNGTPGTPSYASGNAFVPQSQIKMMQQQQRFNDSPLSTAPVFQPPQPLQQQQVDYGDEMDWSPSQPQHRAFRSSPQHSDTSARRLPFGQSPTQGEDKNPFWFKVPAAPTNPARQLRNPANMPVLRKKPVEKDQVFFTSRRDSAEYKKQQRLGAEDVGGVGSTSFKHPRFFAPEENDEANSLADMLGQSFSLSQDQQQQQQMDGDGHDRGTSSPFSVKETRPGHQVDTGIRRGTTPKSLVARHVELLVLSVLLPLWLVPSFIPSVPYQMELRAAILVGAGVIALSGTSQTQGDQTRQRQQQQSPSPPTLSDAVLSALGIMELAGLCWIGWETWTERMDVGGYGTGVLAVMLGHYAWKAVKV